MIPREFKDDMELMGSLEGDALVAYDCSLGYRTVGKGFNMEQVGAKKVWDKLNIAEDFDEVFEKKITITQETSDLLFMKVWMWCIKEASRQAKTKDLEYKAFPEYKKFITAGIAYNTGSCRKWHKVFTYKNPRDVLYEARRNPKKLMDSRVAKIGYYYKIIKSLDDAHKLGLEFARYVR